MELTWTFYSVLLHPPSLLQGYQVGDFDDNTVQTGNFLDYEEMTDIFGHKAKTVWYFVNRFLFCSLFVIEVFCPENSKSLKH